jgi:transcriptional regulator with XRE-family HTH domain
MQNEHTWRALLTQLIADHAERQRIAQQSGIHQMTLTRWATGASQPRLDLLRTFVQALPASQEELRALLLQDYPYLLEETEDQETLLIPSPFYARVFHAHTTLPPQLREVSVTLLILQQMLKHFDPHRTGMMIFIARCMPPTAGYTRSLRLTLGRANGPWEQYMEQQQTDQQTIFFGAESQPGYTVVTGRLTLVIRKEYTAMDFPAIAFPSEVSILTVPLLMADRVAGCICLLSTQAQYFTQERVNLAELYADILTATLNEHDFYQLHAIKLGIFPPRKQQWSVLTTFKQRLTTYQRQHILTREEAEQRVWHDIESALLRITQTSVL